MSVLGDKDNYELVEIDEDHAKATAFNMLFMIWRCRTTSEAYERATPLARALFAKFPAGIGVLQVVEVDAVPPDSEARRKFVDFLRLKGLKHYSVTHEGTGFKAASVRAIVAGGHALSRAVCEHSVHAKLSAAAAWHEQQQHELGRHDSAAEIEFIAQAVRELHRERYP
jgi:hypothetical protein